MILVGGGFVFDDEVGSARAQISSCGAVHNSRFFVVLGRGSFGSGAGVLGNIEELQRNHRSKECQANDIGDWQVAHFVLCRLVDDELIGTE